MVIFMFSGYKVINNVLYLYVDYKCEIGNIFNNKKKNNIVDSIKKFIKEHKIKFDGVKVILLLSGLMIGTVYLNNDLKSYNYDIYPSNKYVYNVVDKSVPSVINTKEYTNQEIKTNDEIENQTIDEKKAEDDLLVSTDKNDSLGSNNKTVVNNSSSITKNISENITTNPTNIQDENIGVSKLVTLRRTNGQIIQMDIEEYLVGVVASEMPASFSLEALKAQAVVARTYTLKLLEQGRTLTDDVSTQVYKSNDELKDMWQGSYNTYYNKVKNAVNSTKGIVINYNGTLIDAVYHSTSNGYTEDALYVWGNDVPYLKSVTSLWDTSASSFLRITDKSFEEISSKLGIDFSSSSIIEIISKDDSNRIIKIKVNGIEYSGVQIRNLLGLRSTDFDFSINDLTVSFTTRGYGHGVGMSQYGANGMANEGYSYEQILKHYYTGVDILKYNY